MASSYNGWTASKVPSELAITPLTYKGESFAPGVRGGDVHFLFTLLVADLDHWIEPIYAPGWHEADEWGWNYRVNRNANNLSCHASGTAIDYNATRHPNGKRGTFVAWQVNGIRNMLRTNYRSLIRWGGDFTGTPDEMHFEVVGTVGQVRQFVAEMKAVLAGTPAPKPVANVPAPTTAATPWLSLPAVRSRPESFQRWYNAHPFKPALLPVIKPIANNFGPQSEAALKKVQARYGLVADGIDGPLTKKLLWDLGWRG